MGSVTAYGSFLPLDLCARRKLQRNRQEKTSDRSRLALSLSPYVNSYKFIYFVIVVPLLSPPPNPTEQSQNIHVLLDNDGFFFFMSTNPSMIMFVGINIRITDQDGNTDSVTN